ncbi:glycerate 2-kinase 1 [Vibrio crassostreae]|uniref:glycerate kinase n=1 Tax=Vibrio crassostreae TaxID=246167 RepID=UPI00104DA773|nr:glycerate kinase [Vibrio crassostreae]TCN82372.1 glycerate 2-kinase [Vibrio crassostreae]CAK2460711.1 glycerate 2-kinase 1 [Vibrio crassostreae]CAK2465223.1 glycerate 2-kinase 1 [Vibrio crassostreae]CAK3811404.1 glycerate 2-kinase 1 [Vibrio crassostreae]CAK3933612.1 glycerate 2-kinase 1 [Vibrio crassostreae]
MKIVIAPDSFKESLTAKQVCDAVEKGFSEVFPQAQYVHLPLADGGEGTVDVLLQGLDGEVRCSLVSGPLGSHHEEAKISAQWALLDNGNTALIEVAAASGLDLIDVSKRDPTVTTTYGTGELIREALDLDVSKIMLGLGGSATNDGGAGILQALGGKLLDRKGNELPKGGAALADLVRIDLSQIHPRCKDVEFIVACDVANPLIGLNGASQVFGPQKGASQSLVTELDQSLAHFAKVSKTAIGIDHSFSSGFGAAGGTPLGLSLMFDVQIKPGIEMILDALDADKVLEQADLVITGEGQMDNQTLEGKTPFGIAKRAKAKSIPVIGIAGSLGSEIDDLYATIDSAFASVRSPQSLEQVLQEASMNVTRTSRNIAATLKLGASMINTK